MLRSKLNAESLDNIEQFKINYICSCLLLCKISTSKDLIENFDRLIEQINQNPKIFKQTYTPIQCYQILREALKAYNSVNALNISLPESYIPLFEKATRIKKQKGLPKLKHIETKDDLFRVTKNYDRFSATSRKKETISNHIATILKDTKFAICPHVIIGAGDTGTTLWLEKFKSYHGKTKTELSKGKLPDVLMINNGFGSWKHNYTLAQPHNILERTTSNANPSDYVSEKYYRTNPYANGRHVYQANQVSLAKTQAPLLKATVIRIEKNNHHIADWESKENNYRLILSTLYGEKTIYTNEINICTGLGPVREEVASKMKQTDFKRLTQFDSQKKFTPIIDGTQFILTSCEERSPKNKTIVVYGGGGTAAACYRKGFFGHDVRTEGRVFDECSKKNSMIWVAKQFNKAGTGKLATSALKSAKERKELFQGELDNIETKPNGKLLLTFINLESESCKKFQIECDQFIYSIGHDDKNMKEVCQEIDSDLAFNFDKSGMLLNISTKDNKVILFGAAAMAYREREYMDHTWKWLKSQNIGGDVGPGSMPPSRAQIKRTNALNGITPESINANIDSSDLILEYICSGVRIHPTDAALFVNDLLEARKHSTSGCTRKMLKQVLEKHHLNEAIAVYGHGQLVLREKVLKFHSLFPTMKKNANDDNNSPLALKTIGNSRK